MANYHSLFVMNTGKITKFLSMTSFIFILFIISFVGTSETLLKMRIYSSWAEIFTDFQFNKFFISQPSMVYFGGFFVSITYIIIRYLKQ